MNAFSKTNSSLVKNSIESVSQRRLAKEIFTVRDSDAVSPEKPSLPKAAVSLPDYEAAWLREMLYFDRF
jgi:hypothetical protein